MIQPIAKPFVEFFNLMFPPVCTGCGRLLNESETLICIHCESKLAYLNYSPNEENAVEELFWGKVKVEKATAFFKFIKGGCSQNLLHKLKYKHMPEIGVELGLRFGQQLKRNGYFHGIDYLIPVPLHRSRRKKRGYNQSEMIAEGMAQALNLPIDKSNLRRVRANDTQTKKDRLERDENVKQTFALRNPNVFAGKRVLLIDDVVTTGATLIACAEVLLECPDIKVSIACLAKA